jgi:hypothetical protein
MIYTRDVEKNEELFSIPTETMIYTSNPHISETTNTVLRLFR